MTGDTFPTVTRDRASWAPSVQPIFRAKTPLRLSFAGGGTDVAPFPEREGGLVLSATINRFAQGSLRPRDDGRIRIQSYDLDTLLEYSAHEPVDLNGELDLVKGAISRISHLGEARGADLFLHTAAPPGSGLGASSALMVTLIGLLRDFQKLSLTEYEIAHLAWEIERVDLGLSGGMQDQYAAAFGGFNFIEFEGKRVIVNPLRIPASTMHELEANTVLFFTGSTRAGDHIIDDQTARYETNDEDTLSGMRMQKELAVEMKNALLRGRLNHFGELLGTAWNYKKLMSPRITTPKIDEAYAEAVAHGARGGKVTGAGGGGFMMFYCEPFKRHNVVARLRQLGLEETPFSFVHDGLTTWTYVEE